jgi:hypothetical protein
LLLVSGFPQYFKHANGFSVTVTGEQQKGYWLVAERVGRLSTKEEM